MTSLYQTEAKPAALIALAGATLLASLGVSIASIALPTLSRAFSAPISVVQWVVLAYLISVTVAVVTAGRLGDIYGHRRVLIIGLALFTTASVLCASAPTLGMLIAGRAVQGIGGATLMSLPISIVRGMVAKERTGSVMGLLGTMSAIGTALGPSLGGLLIASFGWRSAFMLLAGLGFLVLGLAVWALPDGPIRTRSGDRRMDWPGFVLLAVTLIVYSLATVGGKADVTWSTSVLLSLALLTLMAFILVETRTASPLVPLSVLLAPKVGVSLAINVFVSTVMMSTLIVGPFFLAFGLGLNEAMAGVVMAVGPVTAALAGIPAGRITDRFGASRILIAGLIVIVMGLVGLAFLPRLLGLAGFIAALITLTPGFQLFLAANNTAVMAGAPEEQRGMVSGLLGLSRNMGFMTGASVMTTFFAAAVGSADISIASARAVLDAFTMTFLASASLTLLALILALLLQLKTRN